MAGLSWVGGSSVKVAVVEVNFGLGGQMDVS